MTTEQFSGSLFLFDLNNFWSPSKSGQEFDVWCFGSGLEGYSKHNTNESWPLSLDAFGGRRIKQISCGNGYWCILWNSLLPSFTLFLTTDGRVWSVGKGKHGRLGQGTLNSTSSPKMLGILSILN